MSKKRAIKTVTETTEMTETPTTPNDEAAVLTAPTIDAEFAPAPEAEYVPEIDGDKPEPEYEYEAGPIVSQAAIDAYYEFQQNPDKVFRFALDEINIDHGKNGRKRKREAGDKDVIALAEDIKKNGVLQPVIGRFDEETRAAHLVFGYGRAEAVALANSTLPADEQILLPVMFSSRAAQGEKETLLLNISENVKRKDLTAIDTAYDMQRLKETGMTNVEIAEVFGVAKSAVTGYMSLMKLPEWVQDRIGEGVINYRAALDLAAVQKENPDKVDAVAKKLVAKALETGSARGARIDDEAKAEVTTAKGGTQLIDFKGLKDLVAGTTGPGEDVRVKVVNLVLHALLTGNAEKEYGIGKVSVNTYGKKLLAALDGVSTVAKAAKGKAAA